MSTTLETVSTADQTVMVVDDTPATLAMVAEYLESHGLRVVVAGEGQEALERALRVQPDLILLDVMMPGMDGFEICRRLKGDQRTKDIPVVFMTALTHTEHRVAGLREGAVDYVVKPLALEEVLVRVGTHLALRRLRRQLEHRIEERTAALERANASLRARQAEREMLLASERAARSEAERAGRLKDEFLATLSHELRTPLNAILGWSQLLRSRARAADALEKGLETIERNARSQAKLIEDLLEVSRIISGKVRLEIHAVDLSAVIEAVVASVKPAANAKAIGLELSLEPTPTIAGDFNRLQQVVWNLLSNAIKFTPSGGHVRVTLRRDPARARITVADTGIGIKPEFLPYVFDRFRQADASTTRRHRGLGLGLALVRHLVELHGGAVEVDSRGENQGASFGVTLPLGIAPAEVAATPSVSIRDPSPPPGSCEAVELDGLRVLAVDDEPDTRELIRRVLSERHAEVLTASSAAEALAQVSDWRPDVLVSDIGMPEEDGYWLIRRVRELPSGQGRSIPALALTAFAREEDRARAMESGYQAHVAKPVEPWQLVASVAKLTGRTGARTAGSVAPPSP